MKTVFRTLALAIAVAVATGDISAQTISLSVRGGGAVPTGAFSDKLNFNIPDCPACDYYVPATMAGAKSGFGYGLDAGLQMGIAGVYASFDHIDFDCTSFACDSDGKYKLTGATAGVKLAMPTTSVLRPFVKGGITFDKLEGAYVGQKVTTDRKPGYEVGAGLDIGILGLVSLTPQVRYIGQNFKYNVPSVVVTGSEFSQKANYYSFDIGLSVHNPIGRMKR